MIDLSGIEYNFIPGLLVWLVPVGVAVSYLWWMFATGRDTVIGALCFVFGGVWLLTGGPIMLAAVPSAYVDQIERSMTVVQLEEQGFANISMKYDRKFTASRDGVYFRGALVQDHGHVYQVVELSVD